MPRRKKKSRDHPVTRARAAVRRLRAPAIVKAVMFRFTADLNFKRGDMSVWRGYGTLSHETGFAVSNVRLAVADCVESGFLVVMPEPHPEQRDGHRGKRAPRVGRPSTHYRVCVEALEAGEFKRAPRAARKQPANVPATGTNGMPVAGTNGMPVAGIRNKKEVSVPSEPRLSTEKSLRSQHEGARSAPVGLLTKLAQQLLRVEGEAEQGKAQDRVIAKHGEDVLELVLLRCDQIGAAR